VGKTTDQALLLEVLERIANGPAAHPERRGEPCLDEPASNRDGPGLESPEEPLGCEPAQARGRNRRQHYVVGATVACLRAGVNPVRSTRIGLRVWNILDLPASPGW